MQQHQIHCDGLRQPLRIDESHALSSVTAMDRNLGGVAMPRDLRQFQRAVQAKPFEKKVRRVQCRRQAAQGRAKTGAWGGIHDGGRLQATNCLASSKSRGPLPNRTKSPAGTKPTVFSSNCAAPAYITPGSMAPGSGMGRSIAPVAINSRLGAMERVPPTSPTTKV